MSKLLPSSRKADGNSAASDTARKNTHVSDGGERASVKRPSRYEEMKEKVRQKEAMEKEEA